VKKKCSCGAAAEVFRPEVYMCAKCSITKRTCDECGSSSDLCLSCTEEHVHWSPAKARQSSGNSGQVKPAATIEVLENELKRLKLALAETERAGEEIRAKNVELLEQVKRLKAETVWLEDRDRKHEERADNADVMRLHREWQRRAHRETLTATVLAGLMSETALTGARALGMARELVAEIQKQEGKP
jgi:hypothetical protein